MSKHLAATVYSSPSRQCPFRWNLHSDVCKQNRWHASAEEASSHRLAAVFCCTSGLEELLGRTELLRVVSEGACRIVADTGGCELACNIRSGTLPHLMWVMRSPWNERRFMSSFRSG